MKLTDYVLLFYNKMAYVDLSTGEIYGCEKGSLTYLHELGHLEYHKTKQGNKNDFTRETMKTLTIVFSLLGHLHYIFLYLGIGYLLAWIYYSVYEEIWCWRWAFKNKKE